MIVADDPRQDIGFDYGSGVQRVWIYYTTVYYDRKIWQNSTRMHRFYVIVYYIVRYKDVPVLCNHILHSVVQVCIGFM